jgi:hypothetical protein
MWAPFLIADCELPIADCIQGAAKRLKLAIGNWKLAIYKDLTHVSKSASNY